jgi:hypothetical protein
MAALIPNNGEGDALSYFVNKSAPQNLVLKLFKNDKTPAEGDVAADYTECDFAGYASVTLTGANWTVTEGAPSSASYAQQVFTNTGAVAQSVYGYYLVRASTGRIAYAERFTGAPFVVQNVGDEIKITPTITAD